MHTNYEFKARVENMLILEEILLKQKPVYKGLDHQVDTYFNVQHGRLKMREGNIENALIQYERRDQAGPKQSDVSLFSCSDMARLKSLLTKSLGIKTVVDKKRKIYFIDNIKFHFDEVKGLGQFIEVEAIDMDNSIGIEKLKEQCNVYAQLFQLQTGDFIAESYSDMLVKKILKLFIKLSRSQFINY